MKTSKKLVWMLTIIILIATTSVVVHSAVNSTLYLPVVMRFPTGTPVHTPTITPTPSRTPTPTSTPRVTGVKIVEVVQSENVLDPLNEYVSIHNFNYDVADLTGWFLRDDGLNRYNFPINFIIPSGKTIRVWTKEGTNTITDLYWGSEVEVWNDFNECAYLRDDSEGENELVDVYCYAKQFNGSVKVWREIDSE